MYARQALLHSAAVQYAGGDGDVSTLMKAHARAHPKLYRELNVASRSEMTLADACALGNEQTGLLGAAFRRHFRAMGIRVPPKHAVTQEFKACWHPSETGKVGVQSSSLLA